MGPRIREIANKNGEDRGIPAEVKNISNSYYLYKDTTKWEKKKRVCVSKYIGRINENGLVEKNRRSFYELGNSELLQSTIKDLVPELRHHFSNHGREIIAMSMIRWQDPRHVRYMRSP